MLKTKLINPDILDVLSRCGHGSRVLIADGNYPVYEKAGDATIVNLALVRGLPSATDVLDALMSAVNVEEAYVMEPEDGSRPEVFDEFEKMLGDTPIKKLGRWEFYDACMKTGPGSLVLAIETGEKRTFSNILIQVNVA